ncbi:MAG: DUF58 domain-containing protein, partial [Acidobacteriota bacterium]|nr:DUF58 domain-containing protein [Acidobacteriota bacterium]
MLRSVLRRFPLSLSGTTAIALSAIAFFHGARRQDLVLTLAGVWGLLVVGATGAAVMAYAWRTRRDLRLAVERAGDVPLDGVEERAFATGVTIPRRAWPLVTELDWIWSEPAAGVCVSVNGNRLAEQAVPRSRWFGARIVRSYVVQDLLGLWRIRGRLVRERPVLVLPDTGLLRAADVATCLSSGDLASHPFGDPRGDRVDFRTYTRSDPARLILWKVYARTRELMVRV